MAPGEHGAMALVPTVPRRVEEGRIGSIDSACVTTHDQLIMGQNAQEIPTRGSRGRATLKIVH